MDTLPLGQEQDLDQMLRMAVGCVLDSDSFEVGLRRFRTMLPHSAPDLVAQFPPDHAALSALAFSLFREVWNRTPQPAHDWRTMTLPKLERNAPCPCGSGRKYKVCCGAVSGASPFGETGLSMLPYVLERMPMSRFKELPFKKLSPEELGHVAHIWAEQGRHQETVKLLEPMLTATAQLDARHEYAFDVLCEAYLALNNPVKRVRLVERLMEAQDRTLKVAAMHRRCTMLADKGDYAGTWSLFKEAQRLDPDNPSLSHLEIVLLVSQGDMVQAQSRARFLATRLKRLGQADAAPINWLQEMAENPQALEGILSSDVSHVDEHVLVAATALDTLAASLNKVTSSKAQYTLQPDDDGDAGPLTPSRTLRKLDVNQRPIFSR